MRFGYITAWRANEILNLDWSRVDFSGRGRAWLDGGMTKNGKPRVFKMTRELRERLVKQPDGSWKTEPGQPIRSFVKAWRAACVSAGYTGRIFHDLRRSAIRNFVRAGG